MSNDNHAAQFTSDFLSAWSASAVKNGIKKNLSPLESLTYYAEVAPVADAINKIAREAASIKPLLLEIETDEYDSKNDLIKLLNHTSADNNSSYSFFYSSSVYLSVTGNNYVLVTGDVDKEPEQLIVLPTNYITMPHLKMGGSSVKYEGGCVDSLIMVYEGGEEVFYREIDGDIARYINQKRDKEIIFMHFMNPTSSLCIDMGMPPLMPILREMEQYRLCSELNEEQLRNGGSTSLVLEVAATLSDDEYQRIKQQFQQSVSGNNQYKIMVTQEGQKIVDMTKSNKDMDFVVLKENARKAIYNGLGVPLPLAMDTTMTYSNQETARLALYDNSIVPLINKIYTDLSAYLLPRFGYDKNKYRISYDETEIPALALRKSEQIKVLKETGVMSDNEIRKLVGFKPYKGGDFVYKQGGAIPSGKTTNIETQEPDTDYVDNEEELNQKKMRVRSELSGRLNIDGTNKYSQIEIDKIISNL